ncbi:MAG: hypothetical protein ABI042_11085 [Verrucomicrobiota bacterium]
MKFIAASLVLVFAFPFLSAAAQTNSLAGKNPADELPSHIKRITWFGERADWSSDGKRILFLGKTFGDVYEVEVASGIIRAMSHHFPHCGFTRALYLANGDILLSGPETFDPKNPGDARTQCFLSVLDKSLTQPPWPLGKKCSEGPAVSRKRMHIAWTIVSAQYPDTLPSGAVQMREADIIFEAGKPKLANERLIIDSRELPVPAGMETQNFVPPDEKELTFTYGIQNNEVGIVELATRKVRNLTDAPGQYDEPEGVFPDGKFTLVECDKQNKLGPRHIDLWKLRLDGGGYVERLTFFSDYPGYKASNPVVSDDGRFIAFQMAKSNDDFGVGHGIFVLDLKKTKRK